MRWDVGARIRGIRVDRGMSQVDLQNAAGLDNKTVSRVENGHRNVGIDYLARIARALDVPLWRLFRDE